MDRAIWRWTTLFWSWDGSKAEPLGWGGLELADYITGAWWVWCLCMHLLCTVECVYVRISSHGTSPYHLPNGLYCLVIGWKQVRRQKQLLEQNTVERWTEGVRFKMGKGDIFRRTQTSQQFGHGHHGQLYISCPNSLNKHGLNVCVYLSHRHTHTHFLLHWALICSHASPTARLPTLWNEANCFGAELDHCLC